MTYVIPLDQIELCDAAEFGGENASLAELTRALGSQGIAVPRGFALSARAFSEHLAAAGLAEYIYPALDALDVADLEALAKLGNAIRRQVRQARLPSAIEQELVDAYQSLSHSYGEEATEVAVHASATVEGSPTASLSGQQESYLNVRGAAALLEAVRSCMTSLFTDQAIGRRAERGFEHRRVSLSVGVQKMVSSRQARPATGHAPQPEPLEQKAHGRAVARSKSAPPRVGSERPAA